MGERPAAGLVLLGEPLGSLPALNVPLFPPRQRRRQRAASSPSPRGSCLSCFFAGCFGDFLLCPFVPTRTEAHCVIEDHTRFSCVSSLSFLHLLKCQGQISFTFLVAHRKGLQFYFPRNTFNKYTSAACPFPCRGTPSLPPRFSQCLACSLGLLRSPST